MVLDPSQKYLITGAVIYNLGQSVVFEFQNGIGEDTHSEPIRYYLGSSFTLGGPGTCCFSSDSSVLASAHCGVHVIQIKTLRNIKTELFMGKGSITNR